VRRRVAVAAAVLAALAAPACVRVVRAPVDLGAHRSTIDNLYVALGKYEMVLCLRGALVDSAWVVTQVTVPPQVGNDSVRVQRYRCGAAEGTVHNHPVGLSPEVADPEQCRMSHTDSAHFARDWRRRFAVVWCGPDKFVTYGKTR
jgi:hypothetical protein